MIKREDLFPLGFVSRTHGFSGDVVLALSASNPLPKKLKFIFISVDGGEVPFLIEKISQSGDTAIAKFEDVADTKDASKITGCEIFGEKKLFKKTGNIADDFSALSGFMVFDQTLGNIGLVSEVIEVAGQLLLMIKKDGKEILIPAQAPILSGIDDKKKIISVDLPEGLLEIYD